MEIEKKLLKEIETYCKTNNIIDIDKFINELVVTGFTIKKYGNAPTVKKTVKNEEKKVDKPQQPIVKTNKDDDYEDLYDNDKFGK